MGWYVSVYGYTLTTEKLMTLCTIAQKFVDQRTLALDEIMLDDSVLETDEVDRL